MKASRIHGFVVIALVCAALGVVPSAARADNSGDIGDYGEAEAGSATDAAGRLHLVQYNVCDSYLVDRAEPACKDHSPTTRATYVAAAVQAFGAQAATFEEMCQTTLDMVLANLGAGWYGQLHRTVLVPEPLRCGPAGVSTKWGVAIIAHTPISNYRLYTLHDLGEDRVLWCGNVTIYSGFRLCATHLTYDDSDETGVNQQLTEIADLDRGWNLRGDATIIGGDFNMSVRWPTCDPYYGSIDYVNRMKPMYWANFGQAVRACGPGINYNYELDNTTAHGDSTYEESTIINSGSKFDYIFANIQRFDSTYGADARIPAINPSDHRYLVGAVTVHD